MKSRDKRPQSADVISIRQPQGAFTVPLVGRLVGLSEEGLPLVDFVGNGAAPVVARVACHLAASELEDAATREWEVVLLFEEGLPSRPILMGLLPPSTRSLRVVETSAPAMPEVAQVDGRRVVLTAQDEVVLTCGEASITLRRNGRVVIRGTHIESHASGVQRIKGAAVKVN